MAPQSHETLDENANAVLPRQRALRGIAGLTNDRIARDGSAFGALLETFGTNEIHRLITSSDARPTFHHYRDKDQDEVDIHSRR